MAVPPVAIRIDYDALFETLTRSVRRAAVMMGIGLNAADLQPPVSHILARDGRFGITLVPEEVNDESRQHFAEEFGKWVRACGLRELLESFSGYISQLYQILYVIDRHTRGAANPALMLPEKFEQRGISDQMKELAKVLVVEERVKTILASLNQARNCYAHRQGRVGPRDLDNDRMVVTWNRPSLNVREPNGNIIPEDALLGHLLEEGGVLLFQFVEEERVFRLGDELVLQNQELKEICLFTLLLGEQFFKQAIDITVAAGLMAAPEEQAIKLEGN